MHAAKTLHPRPVHWPYVTIQYAIFLPSTGCESLLFLPMIQLPPPSHQRNCRVVSVTVPREVLAEAHELVQKAEISFSVYVAELLRVDLASRKKHQAAEQGKAA